MKNGTFPAFAFGPDMKVAFLAAASVAISLGFACMAPLVAFGVFAAVTFDRERALISIVAVWLANQAAGYLVLGYPTTVDSFAWGALIGFAAVASTAGALVLSSQLSRLPHAVSAVAAFFASFAIYEIALFAAALLLGGTETFSLPIVARLFETNAAVMAALLLLDAVSTQSAFKTGRENVGRVHVA